MLGDDVTASPKALGDIPGTRLRTAQLKGEVCQRFCYTELWDSLNVSNLYQSPLHCMSHQSSMADMTAGIIQHLVVCTGTAHSTCKEILISTSPLLLSLKKVRFKRHNQDCASIVMSLNAV